MIGAVPSGSIIYPISAEKNEKVRANYCSSISGCELAVRNENREAYVAVFEILLNLEIINGKIKSGDQNNIDDLVISTGSLVAEYTNPNTGNVQSIDLLAIEEPAVKKALEVFYQVNQVKYWHGEMCVLIAAYSKGNLIGRAPLNKKHDGALLQLPNSLEYAFQVFLPQALLGLRSSTHRNILVRRLLFVEYCYPRFCKLVTTKLQEKEKVLNVPSEDRQKNLLQSEIKSLRTLRDNLNNFDIYALSKALVTYPIGHVWSGDFNIIASNLQKQIEAEMVAQQTWWDRSVLNKQLSEVQKEYARDVVGMLYIDRGKYFSYCADKHINKKSEIAADVFMREAICFAVNGKCSEDGFKKSILTHDFGADLKEAIGKEFDDFVFIASHAIGHSLKGEYELDKNPENANQEQIKKIDQQRIEILRKQISAHRARVNTALNLDQISRLPDSKL